MRLWHTFLKIRVINLAIFNYLSYPFQAQYVQNCYTGDKEKIPFPPASEATGLLKNILDTRTIKILAYGRIILIFRIKVILS